MRPRFGALAALAFVVPILGAIAAAQATVTVGLYFVEGTDEPVDALNIPGLPEFHFIQPWQITGAGTEFVNDGAFAGVSESDARAAVVAEVKNKFYSIPTPTGYVLDIDFEAQKVSGAGTVNVIIGQHNLANTWFGVANEGGALGAISGENYAAVSADRIDSMLTVDFTSFDSAVNAIANVTAHEAAHMFGLEHVWADARADLGWLASDPVIADPYDVMATGPSGLPDAGWIEDNIFTTVAGTQEGGLSSVDYLIQQIGLREIAAVPAPAALPAGLALIGLVAARRRRRC